MNIVFLVPSFNTGGGNRVVFELANELVRNGGINVEVVSPFSEKENTFKIKREVTLRKVRIFRSKSFIMNLLATINYLIKKSSRIDGLIVTGPALSPFLMFLSRHSNVYNFIQADDYRIFDDRKLIKSGILLGLYRLATRLSYAYKIHFLFNSKYTYQRFCDVSKRSDVKLSLVHPALNHNVFYDMNIRKDDELNICLVARKHPWKGFVGFVRAWDELKNEISHRINNIYIMSQDDLSEFDLSDFVLIKPKSDYKMAEIYNRSHIFIATSWWEGFGLPALEAMACGCAVILTDAGGVNEYANPNENCLMYRPKNINELKEKILLIINDADLRSELSRNAQKTAENFSWQKSAGQLEKILGKFETE